MKTTLTLSAVAIAALLIGCGGGSSSGTPAGGSNSSSGTITGYLVDAPVEGVLYRCGTNSGHTDTQGAFYCKSSSVEFYIGKLSLGIVSIPTADGNVYPQDLVGAARTNFTDSKVIEMTQLLQSLDEDTVPSNGIKITSAVEDKFTTGMQFSTKSLNQLLALAGVSAIDAGSAIQHLQDTMGLGSSSSSVSSSASSSSAASGDSINSANLAGYTVVSEYANGTKIKNIKKTSYIFLANNQVIAVFDLYDGSRKVARGSYNQSHGNNVVIISPAFDNDENFMPAFGISTPNGIDEITVGESTAIYNVTAIVDNANNGIDETTVASTTVEGPEENPDAPMYDELNGKSMMIYNSISGAAIGDLSYTMQYNGYTQYNGTAALHCTDYGYSEIFVEGTDNGVHYKTYFLPSDSSIVCMEFDYTNATQGSGSTNVVWYK